MLLFSPIACGQELSNETVFGGHLGAITMARFSGGDRTFVTSSSDETIRLWDIATEKQLRVYSQHTAPVFCLDISGDQRMLVSGAGDNTIRVWSLPNAEPMQVFQGAQLDGLPFALSKVPSSLALASGNGKVTHRTGLSQGDASETHRLTEGGRLTAMVYRDDGAYFVSGDDSGVVRVWSPYVDSVQEILGSSSSPIESLVFVSGNQQLLSASADGVVRVWQLSYGPGKQFPIDASIVRWQLTASGTQAIGITSDRRLVSIDCVSGKISKEILELTFEPVSFAVAPDEKWAALVDPDGATHCLDLASGEINGVVSSDLGKTIAVAIHPDSRRFSTSSANGQVFIWQEPPATDKPIEPTHSLHADASDSVVSSVLEFSKDQQHLYAGTAEGKIFQWNVSTGKLVRELNMPKQTPQATVEQIVAVPNNQAILTAGSDRMLRVWNAADGTESFAWKHESDIRSIVVSTNSLRVASLCADGTICLWDLGSGELLQRWPGDPGAVKQTIGFLNDSATLVAATSNGTFVAEKPAINRAMRIHPQSISAMALVAGGSQVLTCGDDHRVLLTNVSNGTVLREYLVPAEGSSDAAESLEILPTAVAARSDSQRVAAGTASGQVFVWNANAPGEPLLTLPVGAAVTSLAYSPDNQKLLVGTEKGAHVFGPSVPGTQPAVELMEHQQLPAKTPVSHVQFSDDSASLWISTNDGMVGQWNYAGLAQLRQMNHSGAVYGLALSRDGRTLVSCSADQTVRIWETETGRQRAQLRGHTGAVYAIDLSADETFAVSSGADGTLQLWDIAGGRQLKQLVKLDATMYSLAIDPKGSRVAAAGADRKIHLLDMITGQETAVLEGHPDYIHCVRFDATGDRILSYGYAGHLRIWDASDGKLIHQSRIGKVGNDAQISADGKHLLLSGGDATSRLVALP